MARSPLRADSTDIARFLGTSRAITEMTRRQARLIFAIDATASRQATWDRACHLQQGMFLAAHNPAALQVQLCYYRGFRDFFNSQWLNDTQALASQMAQVSCEGGHTQIARLLRHVLAEHKQQPVKAVVFIGDALEENPDTLCQLAGECGLLRLPLFLFQEGHLPAPESCFQSMAKLSGGAWARFDSDSAKRLAELLNAVAHYVSGGLMALESNLSESAKLLLQQIKPRG
ncbi:MAG: VWA domain-containing protein [Parahaliea sp.]